MSHHAEGSPARTLPQIAGGDIRGWGMVCAHENAHAYSPRCKVYAMLRIAAKQATSAWTALAPTCGFWRSQ